jgi:hypothetical protein
MRVKTPPCCVLRSASDTRPRVSVVCVCERARIYDGIERTEADVKVNGMEANEL